VASVGAPTRLGLLVGGATRILARLAGRGVLLASLVVLIALMARVAIRDEPHLLPPGARIDGHPPTPEGVAGQQASGDTL
jgi:hypothetical protein